MSAMPESPPPVVPALLGFVAGYVDSYTFLALFGLFVAQVTGSFVTAGAELVSHDAGVVGKALAILAFLVTAGATAVAIKVLGRAGRTPLPWMLAVETAMLAAFCALMLGGPTVSGPDDWHGILAGLFGAMAMGTQSVLVRLLMRGVPQTNVMTGNMTQIGIETSELALAWWHRVRDPGSAERAAEFAAVWRRLAGVLRITIGFVVGAAAGAVAFARVGLAGAVLSVVLVGALALWAQWQERQP